MSDIPARYEQFLMANSSTIGTIESSIRSLTWFLPGRFKDAEIVGEALTSVLNLLSLYHDTLLARRLALVKSNNPKSVQELIPPNAHTRYTKSWTDKDRVYKWSARGLEVVRYTQLVIEMLLKRFTGRMGRWRGIVILELIKALLRLSVLVRTRRPLITPPIPERDVDPATLSNFVEAHESHSPTLKPPRVHFETQEETSEEDGRTAGRQQLPQHLLNNHVPFNATGKPHPLLSSLKDAPLTRTVIEDYLLPKALTPALIRSPVSLVHSVTGAAQWTSEILYILRPFIYVMMLKPTASNLLVRGNKISTSINYNGAATLNALRTPLAVSLLLSLLSRQLRRDPPVSPSSTNSLERQEYARRDRELLWYLFRGELWSEWTRPKLENICHTLEGKPVLSLIAGVIQDWVPLVDEYWYYTAT
ncbi:peroxisome membrane protein [Serendipita vermifera]|nr:peroxisome membrane protein [Serendipita vermifera]